MMRQSFLLITAACALLAPGRATAFEVGALPGDVVVDNTGQANYEIPISLLPGTGGMEPELALRYGSHGDAGIAGPGWSLSGASSISRGGKTIAQDGTVAGITFTSSDSFQLDGQRLVLIAGTHGAVDAEYRTEVDSFSRVVILSADSSGPLSFQVQTKSGLTKIFGGTTDSRFYATGPNSGSIMGWALSRIEDTVGNYIDFFYVLNGADGEQLLSGIEYTGNAAAGLAPYNRVRFTYIDRDEAEISFLAGSRFVTGKLLKTIEVELLEGTAWTPAWRYELTYSPSGATLEPLLRQIQQFFGAGTLNPLPPTNFEWAEPAPALGQWTFGQAGSPIPPVDLGEWHARNRFEMVDLDGRGKSDLVRYKHVVSTERELSVLRLDESGALQQVSATAVTFPNSLPHHVTLNFGDFQGNGKTDLILHGAKRYTTSSGVERVDFVRRIFTSDGTTFLHDAAGDKHENQPWSAFRPKDWSAADFSGDSKPGFIEIERRSSGGVVSGQGLVFNDPLNVTGGEDYQLDLTDLGGALDTARIHVRDFNADGLADVVVVYESDDLRRIRVYHGKAGGFEAGFTVTVGPASGQIQTHVGDLNGDGIPDLIFLGRSGDWLRYRVFHGTGTDFVESETTEGVTKYAGPWADYGRAFLADMTGNGKADLVRLGDSSGSARYMVFRSNGYDFGHNESVIDYIADHGFGSSTAQFKAADFYGTGRGGFAHIGASGTRTHMYGYQMLGHTPDLLTGVVRGDRGAGVYADRTTLGYETITNPAIYEREHDAVFPVVDFNAPMTVVHRLAADDGRGGELITDFSYAGAKIHVQGRGFLGFRVFNSYDRQTKILKTEQVAQEYPLTGMVQGTETTYMPDPNDSSTAQPLSRTTNTLGHQEVSPHAASVFPFISQSVEEAWELGAALPHATVTTSSIFDQQEDATNPQVTYGNLTKIIVDYGEGFSTTTVNTYANVDMWGLWLLGRLRFATVTSSAPGRPDEVRKSEFAYESGSRALLNMERVEPDDPAHRLTTLYDRDAFGNIQETKLEWEESGVAQSRVTETRVMDSLGRSAASVANTLGHTETRLHNSQGRLVEQTGPNGLTTSFEHDALGRKKKEIRPDNTTTELFRSWDTTSFSHTLPGGETITQTAFYKIRTATTASPDVIVYHDRLGREIRSETKSGNGQTVYKDTYYDRLGRVVAASENYFAGASTIPFTYSYYDDLGRVSHITAPDGTVTENRYNGRETTIISDSNIRSGTGADAPKHQVNITRVDAKGQSFEKVDPENNVLTFEYDAAGNLVRTTDPLANITEMQYDVRGNRTQMSDPNMGTWTYVYNPLGELVSQTDAKNQTTTMEYDSLGRLVKRTAPDGESTWSYYELSDSSDPYYWLGALRKEALSEGGLAATFTRSFYYDSLGRPFLDLSNIDGKWYYTETEFDLFSRVTDTTYYWRETQPADEPTGEPGSDWESFTVGYRYNAHYAVEKVVEVPASGPARVWWESQDNYDANGRAWKFAYGNGIETVLTYHTQTHALTHIQGNHAASGGTNVQDLFFSYDRLGNLIHRWDGYGTEPARSEDFIYDSLNRLRSSQVNGQSAQSVTYNAIGNILSKTGLGTYTYGQNGAGPQQVTAAGNLAYSYDANGNMTGRGADFLTWTSANKPRAIVKGNNSTEFFYDTAGSRIKQVIQNGSEERTKLYIGGGMEQDYASISGGTSDLLRTRVFVGTPGGVVGVYTRHTAGQSDERHFFHKDHLGSVTTVTSWSLTALDTDAPQITEQYSFDAWGKRRNATDWSDTFTNTADYFTDRGYTGHEMLDGVELVHMNGRVYDPLLGRMISADPFVPDASDLQSYNRYSYVNNNPLSYTDPSGFFLKKLFKSIKKFVKKYWKPIVTILLVATQQYWALVAFNTSVGYYYGGVRGAAIGLASSLATAAIGDYFGGIGDFWHEASRALSHGISSAGFAGADGGDVGSAFLAGFVGSAGGSALGSSAGQRMTKANKAANTVAVAVIGGTASKLGGGKFANGAATAAATHALAQMYQGRISDQDKTAVGFADAPYEDDSGGLLAEKGIEYNPKGSFQAALYEGDDGVHYLAFRGTAVWSDWKANIAQAFGFRSSHYDQAVDLAKLVYEATEGNVVFVGHSLGGGLAAAAAYATGGDAVTFNAAGLSYRYRKGGKPGTIRAYAIHGDILTFGQGVSPLPGAPGSRVQLGASRWYRGMVGRHFMNNFTTP